MADEEQTTEEEVRPAWSSQFSPDVLKSVQALGPLGEVTREWAWGGSTGHRMKVAIVDSGIDHDHPAVGNAVKGGVIVEYDGRVKNKVRISDDPQPHDLCGHATACAGIIHSIAPDADLYSVRVLGKDFSGRAMQFAGGLRWAIENGMHVVNLSLSTSMQEYYAIFHELTDDAYFHNVALVSAVNNIPVPSYPSLYSAVFSVAAHEEKDPFTFYYNPKPPVEFGAPGIDVEVAWLDKEYTVGTGNSFAAPHIAGIITLIRAKHPELTPFQIKSVLYACANNAQHHADHHHAKA